MYKCYERVVGIAVFEMLKEIWINRMRMLRVVRYNIKIETRRLYLGSLWKILNPAIQVGIFWLIFGVGIRGGEPIGDVPFLLWLLAGLTPWFFISQAITSGAKSINSKAGIIFKIKYPIATVPVGAVIQCLYDHVLTLVVVVLVFAVHGIFPTWYWLNLIYYISFSFLFFAGLSMITSVVVRLAPDFANLISSLVRMLFFFTPILWQEGNLPPWVMRIFSLNPVRYVVNGFRESLLFEANFWEFPWRIALFLPMAVVLIVCGCWLQKKFAHRFADWM